MIIINKKGFTLVEIVIGMAISVILFGTVGGMISSTLSSQTKMMKETQEYDELTEIGSFIVQELQNATEIKVSQDYPNESGEWKRIYISNNKLMYQTAKDSTSVVYLENASVYTENTFKINFSMSNKMVKITLSAKDILKNETISLLNISSGTIESTDILNDKKSIWYKNDTVSFNDSKIEWTEDNDNSSGNQGGSGDNGTGNDTTTPPDNPPDIVDEEEGFIEEIPPTIDKDSVDYVILSGDYMGTIDSYLCGMDSMPVYKGMIFFNEKDKYWYQVVNDSWVNAGADIASRKDLYRKLSTKLDKSSRYYYGDIIDVDIPGYEGRYKCNVPTVEYWGYPDETPSNWIKVDESVPTKLVSIPSSLPESVNGNVLSQLLEDQKNPNYHFEGEYKEGKTYSKGSIVTVTIKASSGPDYTLYYRKLLDESSDCGPGELDANNRYAWKLYSRRGVHNSAYEAGDVVWVFQNDSQVFNGFYDVVVDYTDDTLRGNDSWINWIVYNNDPQWGDGSINYFKPKN